MPGPLPGAVEETENAKLQQQIERVLVLSIRRHYWDEGWSMAGTVHAHISGDCVRIKGDRRWRMRCGNPEQWVRDVVLYRIHVSTFEEVTS